MTVRVAVVGATGRLGTLVSRLVDDAPELELTARLGSEDPLEAMLPADVVVDVSVPAASEKVVEFAINRGLNVLVGTSGWTSEGIERIRTIVGRPDAAPGLGVLFVPNFSLGSVLATRLAATAARFFESIEIVEAHGAHKIDSPSGTAVRTAELMNLERTRAGRGIVAAAHTDQRARGQQVAGIPVHSLRMSSVLARQDVLFAGTGELLTITHETLSASSYEHGIMLALRGVSDVEGVLVGLDSLLGLGALDDEDDARTGASDTP